MQKNQLIPLLLSSLFLVGCNFNTSSVSSSSEDSSVSSEAENELELLRFEPISQSDLPQPKSLSKAKTNEDKDAVLTDEPLYVRAVVKNTKRAPFVDMVLFGTDVNTQMVFNEGNGDYQCSTTTVLEGDLWVTNIFLQYQPTDINGYLEIKEVTFLHGTVQKAKAVITESNSSKVTYHKHAYGEYIITKAAENYADGEEYRVCSDCGHEDHQVIPAYVKDQPEFFTYELGSDEAGPFYSATFDESYKDTVTKVIVPAEHEGIPVKTLKSGFNLYPRLEEIVLPEGIVNLPSSGFFCSSTPLKRITFPSTLSSLPVMNTSAPMEYVYISEGIETIPSNFFWGTPIDWVYIPSTVKTLWKGPTLCNAGKLFYRGTPEQWEAITFKANGNGEYPLNRPRFYYSESAPTDTEHNYWHFENGVPTEWPNN